jgi:acyl CoA:acetate/3-ketoacid CoA transferase
MKEKSKGYYSLLSAIRDLREDIPDGSIVAANNEVNMALPDVLNSNVVSMYEENATPTVDMTRNNKLRDDIFSTNKLLQKEAILQSGTSYIIYISDEKMYFQNDLFTTINPSGFLSVAKVNK